MVALGLVLVPVLDESVLLVVPEALLTPVEPAFQLEPPVVSPVVAFDSTALPLLVDEVALAPLLPLLLVPLFMVSVELQAPRPKASTPATTALFRMRFMSFSSDDWMTP
jgi:hypothetical protein